MEKLEQAILHIAQHLEKSNHYGLYKQVNEILNPPNPEKFLECDTCRVKLGSPTLCKGCLHNRALIGRLTK